MKYVLPENNKESGVRKARVEAFKDHGNFKDANSDIRVRTAMAEAARKPERRFAQSNVSRAMWATPGFRENVVAALSGKKGHTPDATTKNKISNTLKAHWKDPRFRERATKINQASRTAASKEKISKAAKNNWQNPQHRKKMLAAIKLRKKAPPPTEETKNKIREAAKLRWAVRRATGPRD